MGLFKNLQNPWLLSSFFLYLEGYQHSYQLDLLQPTALSLWAPCSFDKITCSVTKIQKQESCPHFRLKEFLHSLARSGWTLSFSAVSLLTHWYWYTEYFPWFYWGRWSHIMLNSITMVFSALTIYFHDYFLFAFEFWNCLSSLSETSNRCQLNARGA